MLEQVHYRSPVYTHAMHAKRSIEAYMARLGAPDLAPFQQFVQVRASGTSCCGLIVDAFTKFEGGDFWKVQGLEPLKFVGWYPVKAVRQCSGLDGGCRCAGESASRPAPARSLRGQPQGAALQLVSGGVTCL